MRLSRHMAAPCDYIPMPSPGIKGGIAIAGKCVAVLDEADIPACPRRIARRPLGRISSPRLRSGHAKANALFYEWHLRATPRAEKPPGKSRKWAVSAAWPRRSASASGLSAPEIMWRPTPASPDLANQDPTSKATASPLLAVSVPPTKC